MLYASPGEVPYTQHRPRLAKSSRLPIGKVPVQPSITTKNVVLQGPVHKCNTS
jgi:hypothetical protein